MAQSSAQPPLRVQAEPLPSTPGRHPFIANPVPVGVAGFALSTFMLGLYTSGKFPAAAAITVLAVAAFYGGLVQLIAGFFALGKGELFPASFMTSYGAFWFSYVALILFVQPRAGAAFGTAATIFLVMWTVITVIFTIATLGTNWTVFIAFIVFDIAILLEDFGVGLNLPAVQQAGGYAEMLLAAIAWYIVMAEIVNETLGRSVFPLFPFRKPLLAPRAA